MKKVVKNPIVTMSDMMIGAQAAGPPAWDAA
jgi:hypothetical protein